MIGMKKKSKFKKYIVYKNKKMEERLLERAYNRKKP